MRALSIKLEKAASINRVQVGPKSTPFPFSGYFCAVVQFIQVHTHMYVCMYVADPH